MNVVDAVKKTAYQLRKEAQRARERFRRAQRAERQYARQLVAVAKQVGKLVEHLAPTAEGDQLSDLTHALNRYSDLLRPWAKRVAARMTAEVDARDLVAWRTQGQAIGEHLLAEVQHAPTGQVLRDRMAEQVDLITSLPREAAQRVHRLTMQAMATTSQRAEAIQRDILRTGEVTASRARLIARTEVARTASVLTQARAEYVGSEGYIWRTSEDEAVRPLHRKLNGKFIKWDEPPIAGENGERAHAGQIYNCRCWPEPVLPETIK